ncbi:chloroplast heat shock protein 70-1 [Actinidia rufa]|uniref:Chloroplast heat shock protein 70-1 n=1 Tax=Actinidia rufa TaxID=165716 RepID=A0A7J0EQ14_9ERIC|nr:chloroplast heat shock protein 70-1 [Actinidia rufa]
MAASTAQIHVLGGTNFFSSSSNHPASKSPRCVFVGHRLNRNTALFSMPKLRKSARRAGPVRVVAEKVVGIDLGTTNSAVAAMEGGKPVIVTNSEGQRTTPSVVAYTKVGDLLVGQIAKRQAVVNSENTFFSVKRFIGRKMSEVDEEAKQVSYTVVRDENGNVKLECPAMGKQFAAEEISAQVLRKLVDDASKFLNDKVTKAVPPTAYLQPLCCLLQPLAAPCSPLLPTCSPLCPDVVILTIMVILMYPYIRIPRVWRVPHVRHLCCLLELPVPSGPFCNLLELPAASYSFLQPSGTSCSLLKLLAAPLFQFVPPLLKSSIVKLSVLSTSGDTHLGGDDFDKRIVDWLAADFKRNEGIDLLKDKQALQRLTETAEKAKMELSSLTQTNISLPFITATADGPKHIETTLTRAKFEELCSDLLDRLKRPVETALRDAKLAYSDLDEVILVGGSTRIPAVQELVRRLSGKEPNVTVNPDEVVALGAAVQAGVLAGDVSDIVLLDVTPLSLGLETLGGVMTKIIPRNTTLPTSKSEVFSTAADGQTSVEISVLQGEREFVRDNKSLGSFRLDGIPPAPRGVPQIEVKFDIDANGILSVTAVDKGTGKKQDITITGASTLPGDEVERMVKEAEMFSKEDKEKRDAIDTKNQADSVVYQDREATKGTRRQSTRSSEGKVMQLGQSLYNQPGAASGSAGPTPGDSTGPSESSDKGADGDVIEADFTDSK